MFLKIPPLKKILQFQDRISFFIKHTQKATTLQQVTGGKTPNLDEIYQLENKMKYIH